MDGLEALAAIFGYVRILLLVRVMSFRQHRLHFFTIFDVGVALSLDKVRLFSVMADPT